MKAFTGRDELITHLPIRGRGFGEVKILYLLNSQCCEVHEGHEVNALKGVRPQSQDHKSIVGLLVAQPLLFTFII
ncbi:MAG: hypothetical protein WA364_15550 [Candidatus Nitrosopolaris sp.]|jgi:hypothetical protein